MIEIPSTSNKCCTLVLYKSKEGIVLRIGHNMTVVEPQELKRRIEELATDMKIERMKT